MFGHIISLVPQRNYFHVTEVVLYGCMIPMQKFGRQFWWIEYRKIPKNSDTRKIAVINLKVEQGGFTLEQCVQMMQMELQTV